MAREKTNAADTGAKSPKTRAPRAQAQRSDSNSDISLETQTRRLLELYALAQSEGNLSVASQSLKQLTDLHGLARAQNLDAQSLNDMSDDDLDAQIRSLLKETGLADASADLSPTPTDGD